MDVGIRVAERLNLWTKLQGDTKFQETLMTISNSLKEVICSERTVLCVVSIKPHPYGFLPPNPIIVINDETPTGLSGG